MPVDALAVQGAPQVVAEGARIRVAVFRALGQRETLTIDRRGRRILLRPAAGVGTAPFNRTIACVETLTGVVPGTTVAWSEACEVRLDWKLDGLWLLLEPRVVLELEDGMADDMVAKAKEPIPSTTNDSVRPTGQRSPRRCSTPTPRAYNPTAHTVTTNGIGSIPQPVRTRPSVNLGRTSAASAERAMRAGSTL